MGSYDPSKEIELMNTALESDGEVATDAPATEAPQEPEATDAPATDAPEEPNTDAPGTDAPGTDAPGTAAPATDAPEDDDRDKTITELRDEIARLNAEKAEKPTTSAPSTDAPAEEPIDFVSEEEFEDIHSDPKKLNELLRGVYKRATADVEKKFAKRFDSLPKTVSEQVAMAEKLKEIRTVFYSDNSDLEPFQEVVSLTYNKLQAQSPDKPYEDILKEVGPAVRKALKLPEPTAQKKEAVKGDGDRKTPRLPNRKGKPGSLPKKSSTNSVQSEIEDMNKTLGV